MGPKHVLFTLCQSEPGSNSSEEVLHIPPKLKNWYLIIRCLGLILRTLFGEDLTRLQGYGRRISQPQMTGLTIGRVYIKRVKYIYIYIYIYILGCVINNFRFSKTNCKHTFQTSNVLNTTKNYLIKNCFHRSFLFQ